MTDTYFTFDPALIDRLARLVEDRYTRLIEAGIIDTREMTSEPRYTSALRFVGGLFSDNASRRESAILSILAVLLTRPARISAVLHERAKMDEALVTRVMSGPLPYIVSLQAALGQMAINYGASPIEAALNGALAGFKVSLDVLLGWWLYEFGTRHGTINTTARPTTQTERPSRSPYIAPDFLR